jgi:hypothetical protein
MTMEILKERNTTKEKERDRKKINKDYRKARKKNQN